MSTTKKSWAQQNPDKVKKSRDKWVKKNPNYFKEYYETHKKRIQKRRSERYQNDSSFRKQISDYKKSYRKEWIQIIGEEVPIRCSICDYHNNFACIEFHHRNRQEKDYNISTLIKQKPNPKRIKILKEELKKCDVLCNRCHEETHHPEDYLLLS